MSVSLYVVWFLLASLIGWLHESLYSIITTGHWEKRGFLFGPFCPIYGAGTVGALLLFDHPAIASGDFPAWAVFVVSMVGSAILEYSVSVIFERLFGAVWWDYSNLPFNINGRICLPASLAFGVAGVVITYLIVPLFHASATLLSTPVVELTALAGMSFLSCDFTTTVLSLSDLMEKITSLDVSINAQADEYVQQTAGALAAGKDKVVEHVKVEGATIAARNMISNTAEHLTAQQVRLLGKLRHFRSSELRNKAELLKKARRS
ncbi:MAG: putative ABC transporter permease [Coriobacteriales bacterium]|nr:putative ABC transporter permease [Coriobacteriales bacterium]